MAKGKTPGGVPRPSEGELEILNILWERGPSSVRNVHEALLATKEAGYTTTLKLMQIMLEKGLLRRDAGAKVHIYEAAIDRRQTQGQLLRRMIDTVFRGSAASMVIEALGGHTTSRDEMEEIRRYLEGAASVTKNKKP